MLNLFLIANISIKCLNKLNVLYDLYYFMTKFINTLDRLSDYGNIQIHEKVQKMINDRLYALSKLINNSPIQ